MGRCPERPPTIALHRPCSQYNGTGTPLCTQPFLTHNEGPLFFLYVLKAQCIYRLGTWAFRAKCETHPFPMNVNRRNQGLLALHSGELFDIATRSTGSTIPLCDSPQDGQGQHNPSQKHRGHTRYCHTAGVP